MLHRIVIGLIFLCAGCTPPILVLNNQINRVIETTLSPDLAESSAYDAVNKARTGDLWTSNAFTSDGHTTTEQNWTVVTVDHEGNKFMVSVVTLPKRPTRIMVVSNDEDTASAIFQDILQRLVAAEKKGSHHPEANTSAHSIPADD
jgi:hypothetical protein